MIVDVNRYEARALRVYRDIGVGGLQLLVQCERANADMRYRRGDIDFALMHINRAVAAEVLIDYLRSRENDYGY